MNKTLQVFLSVVLLVIMGSLVYLTLKMENKDFQPEEVQQKQNLEDKKQEQNMSTENKIVTLKTNQGDIKIELFLDKAPKTASNFLTLASEGFYDGVRFHRVIKDFMIQSGDPLSKDETQRMYWGTGGPGYSFEDEFGEGLSNVSGTISMANSGPNTNGSQFFINTADNTFLDGKHAVFGKVMEGMDVVTKIEEAETGMNDQPVEDMIIESIIVE